MPESLFQTRRHILMPGSARSGTEDAELYQSSTKRKEME